MKRRRLVIVRWNDAWSCTGGTGGYNEKELIQEKPAHVSTVGYIVRDDKACIILAHHVSHRGRGWKDITFIPRAYIRTVLPYHLKVGRKLPVCRKGGTFNCP